MGQCWTKYRDHEIQPSRKAAEFHSKPEQEMQKGGSFLPACSPRTRGPRMKQRRCPWGVLRLTQKCLRKGLLRLTRHHKLATCSWQGKHLRPNEGLNFPM